ncbi:UrcA family protein [Novosphingobium lentum]|uniref:UrcA family protein n=1 Tax=Novosphingobium lentum TaxID=145287 RepID=UPI0008355AC7|nr:UrcA family protein [Novosphingobium lentum]
MHKGLLTIAAAATALTALPTIASAGEALSHEYSVVGHQHRQGWLTTAGPDAQGRYSVAIDIADLDATTAAGWSKINSRVSNGAAQLCDISAEQPQIPGYYDGPARACRADTLAQAKAQLANARHAAAEGRPVTRLGFATTPASR